MSSPTSPLSPLSPTDGIYKALQAYTPQHEGEIGLSAGDILISVKDLGNGWSLAKNVTRDTLGIFPSKVIAALSDLPLHEAPTNLAGKQQEPQKKVPPITKPRNKHRGGADTSPQHKQANLAGSSEQLDPSRSPLAGINVTRGGHPGTRQVYHSPPAHHHQPASHLPEQLDDSPTDSTTSSDKTESLQRGPLQQMSGEPLPPPQSPASGESDPEADITPDDVEYSSLPTPKRGKLVAQSNKKPQLAVRPNKGANVSSPKVGRAMPTPHPQQGTASQHGQGAAIEMGPTRHRVPPPPPVRISSAGMQRRVNVPPHQLPVQPTAHPADCTPVVMDDDSTPEPRFVPVTMYQDSAANNLELPPMQDRSTSPMTVSATAMAVPIQPTEIYLNTEQENIVNESINCHSPASLKQHKVDGEKVYYQDYRTLECPMDVIETQQPPQQPHQPAGARYKPILRNRHQRVADSKGQHIVYKEPREKPRSSRLILAVMAALVFGLVIFLWMHYYLGYAFMIAVVFCSTLAFVLAVAFALSRLCCCTAAILLPSICTTRGRLGFLIIVTGFLLNGPITNVYRNMEEVSTSMSCSAEQAYNQSKLLLRPFDGMMEQLNSTIFRLEAAAHDVNVGLRPLQKGLNRVEVDMANGREQLLATGRVCQRMVDLAFNECAQGINHAQSQCLGVMGALGVVYHHARDVLDRINPDRWVSKDQLDHLYRRDTILADSELEDLPIPQDNKDICEPLNNVQVCKSLNDSGMLCKPSQWAGDAIEEAINHTQSAMHRLQSTLHFKVDIEPYYSTRINASQLVYEVRRNVEAEFKSRTANFELVVSILLKIVPIGVLLLVYVAYLHIKHYMSKDTYDNVYITNEFRSLDQKRSEYAGESLLPLKRYEKNYLIDTMVSDLSMPEDGLYRIGLCVLVMHLLVSLSCYMFDYILYWVLAMIERHARPSFDVTGQDRLRQVISGEGVIVDLLQYFLEGYHPARLFGYTADTFACLPNAHMPSILNLLVTFILYFILILFILLKAYTLRLRNRIVSYFYPERQKARIVHLYNVILNQRARMPKLLQHRAKITNREKVLLENISVCHKLSKQCPPCRVFLSESSRCLVCSVLEDQSFRDCDTEQCNGVYCSDCFDDLGRVCPLCMQGMDYSDEEEYEELEDDLQPYCRSSKIYL